MNIETLRRGAVAVGVRSSSQLAANPAALGMTGEQAVLHAPATPA